MKRNLLTPLLLCSFILAGPPAPAEMCVMDLVPAATLLLPYFEVDLDDPRGLTTILSINNSSAQPAVAHLTFWTNLAIPVINFDVFLTGYDVVTMDLGDMFHKGNIPITADRLHDPNDAVSPHGNPEWDGDFSSCRHFFPFVNPALNGTLRNRIREGHTGQPISGGICLGYDVGDRIARGYVTIDSVRGCSVGFPSSFGYFSDGGTGIANNDNILFGDYILYDVASGTATAHSMVHIEADASFNSSSTPTGYTFYGSLVDGTGADNREPLATTWASHYYHGAQGFSSEFVVWRDGTGDALNNVSCGTGPAWFPMEETEVVCFDEQENSAALCEGPLCFPLATQKVSTAALGVPFTAGWCRLNLNHSCASCLPGGFGPGADLAQSYVIAIHTGAQVLGGLPAVEIAHACQNVNISLGLGAGSSP